MNKGRLDLGQCKLDCFLIYDCIVRVFGVIVVIDVMAWLSQWMEQRCQSVFSLSDVVRPWNCTFVFLSLSGDVI